MYSVVVAFGLASVMLCIGMAIRAKVKFFQHMLMPVSVIGGILGFILMNLVLSKYPVGGVSVTDFSNIVDVFFVRIRKQKTAKRRKAAVRYEVQSVWHSFGVFCMHSSRLSVF